MKKRKEDCKSMKPNLVLVIAFFLFCGSSVARDPKWFQNRMNDLDKALHITNEIEKIAALGDFIGIGRYGPNSMDNEQRTIFDKAQSALLAIPGHAKFYQDQIEQTRTFLKHYETLTRDQQRRMEEDYLERREDLGSLLNYHGVRQNVFKILGLLPSPESVAVLGHFLEDPEGRDGKDVLGNPIFNGSDVIPSAPNCGKAYFALGKLGIEHPPIPQTVSEDVRLNQERTDAWKQWWSEIKAGTRTYRFKGSPIEYGADGPATPEQIEKARQTRERDEKRAAGHDRRMSVETVGEKEAETKKPSSPLPLLIAAAVAVIVSIVWYVRRKKLVA